jgi:hypothetical protein
MSLNRALGELFKVIREEAAANPEFALRLEEALGFYKPSARRKQAAKAKLKRPVEPPKQAVRARGEIGQETVPAAPALNPISLYTREGEAALRRELEGEVYSREALAALVAEHNLDPAGEAAAADKPALVEQIVVQARKRVERDQKLFDY